MTKPSSTPARRAGRVVALIAAASTLAGCAGVGGSAEAARVGDYVVTDRQVQQVTAELGNAASPGAPAPQPAGVLSVMMLEPVLRPLAEKTGKATSDSQARQVLENLGVANPSDATVSAMRTNRDMQLVGDEGLAQAVEALGRQDVTVSPRYGELDPVDIGQGILPSTPDWIEDSAAQAQAEAATEAP